MKFELQRYIQSENKRLKRHKQWEPAALLAEPLNLLPNKSFSRFAMNLTHFMPTVIVLCIKEIFLAIINLTHRVVGISRRSRADLFVRPGHRLFHRIQTPTQIQLQALIILIYQNGLLGHYRVIVSISMVFLSLFCCGSPWLQNLCVQGFGNKSNSVPLP